jgi:hypothetical protein
MMTRIRRNTADDGYTLPELILYGVLLTMVLAVGASIMISGTFVERTVRNVFGASTSAQLAADSIETGIRNSSGFKVIVPTTGTQMVQARVAQGTTSVVWNCASWYYTPTVQSGSIWYRSSSSAISAPTSGGYTGWTILASGVSPTSGTGIFAISGDLLTFSFKTSAGNDPPASVGSSATSRTPVLETAPCF